MDENISLWDTRYVFWLYLLHEHYLTFFFALASYYLHISAQKYLRIFDVIYVDMLR